MKYLIVILICFNSFALKAIVKVLEAPIYKAKDQDSKVLQLLRKGSVIYVNKNSLYEGDEMQEQAFIKTFTRDGRTGFIETRFIKVVYETLEELKYPITVKDDPTNYILEEPVPTNYPFETFKNRKVSYNLFYQPLVKNSYDYSLEKVRESSNPSFGLEISLRTRGTFDLTDRYYHGFMLLVQTSANDYEFADKVFSQETHIKVGFGSNISYALYKERKFQVESHLKLIANYHRAVVKMEDLSDDGLNYSEEKIFQGFSFQGNVSLILRHIGFFGRDTLDLIHGPGMNTTLPYSLKTDGFSEQDYWNDTKYSSSLSLEFSYNIGLSYSF